MAVKWTAYLLSGDKDGVNKTFTLPAVPDARATRIFVNGDVLFRVPNNPVPTEFSISGSTINLGYAPTADDDVWALIAEATAVITANLVEYRPDFYFIIELRDSAGNLKELFQRDVDSCWWQYFTNGGCGPCEISLVRQFDSYGNLAIDDEVRIWRQLNPLGDVGALLPATLPILLGSTAQGSRQLRYSGIVREIEPVFDHNESVRLRCSGFSRQLSHVAIPEREYQGTDIGAVVRDIIDTFVIPGTRIQRTADLGLVPDIGLSVTDVFFDMMADEAISGLADLGGNVEWGVRADKEFYFVPRTPVLRQTHMIGKDISLYISTLSSDDVVNRVYLRGFDGYRAELNFGAFQPGNQKERIIAAPFIGSDEDAALWGTAFQAKFGSAQRRGQLRLSGTDKWIENPQQRLSAADHPLGLLRVSGAARFIKSHAGTTLGSSTYGSGEYGAGPYTGTGNILGPSTLPSTLPMQLAEVLGATTDHRFRINSVKYTPGDGGLDIDIELGERGSSLADRVVTIEKRLSELRQLAA